MGAGGNFEPWPQRRVNEAFCARTRRRRSRTRRKMMSLTKTKTRQLPRLSGHVFFWAAQEDQDPDVPEEFMIDPEGKRKLGKGSRWHVANVLVRRRC